MKKIIGAIIAIAIVLIIGIGAGYYFFGQNGNNASASISETEAQQAALADAGLQEGDVTFTRTHLDRDDGRAIYDIEFVDNNGTRYDYEIEASTGALRSVDREMTNGGNVSGQTTQNQNNTTTQNSTTGPQAQGEISAEEAKNIALQHAGITEADTLYINTEYDRDDGRTEWSVDFATQTTEYDYEIAAADGSILKAENEPHGR